MEDTSDLPPLTPLPAPIEPIKTTAKESRMSGRTPMATSNPQHATVLYPSTIIYPEERRRREELVNVPHQSDSDDDNEGTERYVHYNRLLDIANC